MPPIVVRDPDFDLADVPRHWLANSAAATGLANAINMLFPVGERFFVRSVNAFKAAWRDDPALAARVKAFYAQEGHHASAHDDFNAVLARHYAVDRFLRWYAEDNAKWERRMPAKLRLATTAAAEHFTAIMAENALSGEDKLFAAAHPEMVRLLGWHAVEEIEHKAVAFDVLKRVDPSYWLRMAGLAYATIMLGRYWLIGARVLWRQDGMTAREAIRALRAMPGEKTLIRRVFVAGIREYMRPSFHPDDRDNDEMAQAWLARMTAGVAA